MIIDGKDKATVVDYKTLSEKQLKLLAGMGDASAIKILESKRSEERTV